MNRLKFKLINIFCILFFFFSDAVSQTGSLDQYKGEFGFLGGTSFYIGDANPSTLFHRSGVAFGALARYHINPRYSLKASVKKGTVGGDTRDFPNQFPTEEYAFFEKNFWDLGLHLEFNFSDYGLPDYLNQSKWFSPYIFAGAGLTSSQDELNGLSTINFNFPFGLGVKCKVMNAVNVGIEWSWHTLFVDNFDVVDQNSMMLDNPYGFANMGKKNNDIYSFANLFVSFDLFKRKYCK